MRFEGLALFLFASLFAACGGNVVVDHGSGNGGPGGSGHGGNGTGNQGAGAFGGSTADVQPVGPSSTNAVGGFNVAASVGVGVGGQGNAVASVGVTSTGSGNTTCTAGACSISSDGSCECTGSCSNGAHVRVSCGTDPGINCSCFENGQFVGNCQPTGAPNCQPDESCCKQFF